MYTHLFQNTFMRTYYVKIIKEYNAIILIITYFSKVPSSFHVFTLFLVVRPAFLIAWYIGRKYLTKHWYHNSLKVLLSQAAAFRNKATKWEADVSLLSVHQQRALDFFCTPVTERTLKYEPAAVHCLLNDVQSTKNCTFCAIQG